FGPEIVWRADSSGFSFYRDSESMFVPVSGGDPTVSPTINSLWGAVSPDGQLVAYTNPIGELHIVSPDGTDTLYTTLENGSFGGWLPDSEHFTVILEVPSETGYGMGNQYQVGALGEKLHPLHDTNEAYPVVWLSNDRFLFSSLGELRMQIIGQPSVLLDENVYNIVEYAWVTP
ncbi:MAG: hypothetical protein HGA82_02100, partial [Anaerolineales bacterium]|nr:hypothetical protein [Anaerolineales bacterium]